MKTRPADHTVSITFNGRSYEFELHVQEAIDTIEKAFTDRSMETALSILLTGVVLLKSTNMGVGVIKAVIDGFWSDATPVVRPAPPSQS